LEKNGFLSIAGKIGYPHVEDGKDTSNSPTAKKSIQNELKAII
jgi:hypothetical protein